jgi:hypothetical protein
MLKQTQTGRSTIQTEEDGGKHGEQQHHTRLGRKLWCSSKFWLLLWFKEPLDCNTDIRRPDCTPRAALLPPLHIVQLLERCTDLAFGEELLR